MSHRDDRMWGSPPPSGSWRGGREGGPHERGGGPNNWRGPPPRDMGGRGGGGGGGGPEGGRLLPLSINPLSGRLQAPPPAEPPFVVDREKVCPLLIRVFCKPGSHHRLEDFAVRGKEPSGDVQIQIHTWKDASLRELCDLIKEVKPQTRNGSARFSFALVYPDRRGHNVMKKVGMVHSQRYGEDDGKTLKDISFQTGDFLDVALLV